MKSKELCVYLERIRSARNISQESFTDDVVSLRQYRRYLNGESDVPFQIIHQLTTKLGIKTDNLLREFEIAKVEETELINKLFNLAVNYAHEEFIKISNNLPIEHIIDKNNQLIYQHSIIIDQLFSNKITKLQAGEANAKLINYPDILNSQIITSVEMLILSSLMDFYHESHSEIIVSKIQKFINDKTLVISGGNEKIFSFVLAKISKYFGIHEDFENVIKFCQIGIDLNLSIKSYYLMDYFYYYSALAYYRFENIEQFKRLLVNCFNVLQFEGNEKKIEKFTHLIEEDFDINFENFVMEFYAGKKETTS